MIYLVIADGKGEGLGGTFELRWRAGRPLFTVEDHRQRARRRLPGPVWAYVENGADEERTLAANVDAYRRTQLRQRVLTGAADVDLATTIAGVELAVPFLLAPTGLTGLVHPAGELAAARAAEAAGTRLTLSTASSFTIEEIATATTARHWFQLYAFGDRNLVDALLGRAGDAGMPVLMVTVDVPVVGNRLPERRHGMGMRPVVTPCRALDAVRHPRWLAGVVAHGRVSARNLVDDGGACAAVRSVRVQASQLRPDLSWHDLEWIRSRWAGPLLVKGILEPDDAQRAVECGADGVVVSNHGGRQLDRAPATLDALPSVVARVGARTEVLVDGGIRTGADIVTALALGARGCLIGRAFLYGLASDGQTGVRRVLTILTDEMRRTMQLLGRRAVAELGLGDLWSSADAQRQSTTSSSRPG